MRKKQSQFSPVRAGRRLRNLRRGMKLTQAALANRVGISRGFLSDLEFGRRDMSIPTLFKFVHHMGVSAEFLMGF